jgi:hypothetical protein
MRLQGERRVGIEKSLAKKMDMGTKRKGRDRIERAIKMKRR